MASRSRRRRKDSGLVKIMLLIAVVAALAVGVSYLRRASVFETRGVRYLTGTDAGVKVIEIDPSLTDIRPALASSATEGESFAAIMDRLKPSAAINGTFYGQNMKPLGDVVIAGKLEIRGAYRNALAITRGGDLVILRRPRKGRFDWRGYRMALGAGPRLVHNGAIDLDPVADGFSHRSLTIGAWRSGVGITSSGKLLLVAYTRTVTFAEFARVMRELGCVEAMNLDGGGACGLYHNGRTIVSPTLPMTNILAVFPKSRM